MSGGGAGGVGHVGGMRRASLPTPGGPPIPAPVDPPSRPAPPAPAAPRELPRELQHDPGPINLPRREPMANMAPQLRDGPRPGPSGPLAGRSPEQARALLSSIRQGFRTGLSDTDGPDGPQDQAADGSGMDDDWRNRP
jgi:hypothetical protein